MVEEGKFTLSFFLTLLVAFEEVVVVVVQGGVLFGELEVEV